jgi:type IV pilus assembly protein PilN
VIRINLLPQKRRAEQRAEASQLWLLAVLAAFLLEVVGLFVLHSVKGEELKDQNRKNAELTTQIERSTKAVANHKEIKDQLTELRAREDSIAKLQSARTGPTAVMLELARLLTPGRGPSVDPDRLLQYRKDNPLAVYNPSWDSRRLWLTKFVENQRKVRLEGYARDGEDVSELAKRLSLSAFFYEVTLLPARTEKDKETQMEVVRFELEAKVRY